MFYSISETHSTALNSTCQGAMKLLINGSWDWHLLKIAILEVGKCWLAGWILHIACGRGKQHCQNDMHKTLLLAEICWRFKETEMLKVEVSKTSSSVQSRNMKPCVTSALLRKMRPFLSQWKPLQLIQRKLRVCSPARSQVKMESTWV